ncbi:MAG: DHHA1 domain-containing protein [Candidatus Paceibacterota bacterium]|jgi:oligoribonuclease NrnB/cAMP/cGMP phosphodiesterase (DHH superfamily)
MKDIVVLYHKDCWDGFGAAWAAWKKFGDKAQYIPVGYEENLPKGLINKEIYLVDFCYEDNLMKKIIGNNKKVIVIDHHFSREKFIKSVKGCIYGRNNSGSILSWKYFHPNKKVPIFLKHIEDIDLWSFKLKDSYEIMLAVDLKTRDFNSWSKIAKDLEDKKTKGKYINEGKIILNYTNRIVTDIAKKAVPVLIDGKKAMAVNGPHFIHSEIGNVLHNNEYPIGLIWRAEGNNIFVSLRSKKGGKTDVSKIAKKYGGGGHKSASGFGIKNGLGKKLPWRIIKQ